MITYQYILKPLPNYISLGRRSMGVRVGMKFPNLGSVPSRNLRKNLQTGALKAGRVKFYAYLMLFPVWQ